MTLLAPAKLTLSLRVTGVRPDGLHTLESEMVSVSLFDELRLSPIAGGEAPPLLLGDPFGLGRLGFGMSQIPLDGENLVFRAMTMAGVGAKVEILKRIPPGAGLGGGSADAAAILRALAPEKGIGAALSLGSDVPFCVHVGRATVGGVGDEISPLPYGAGRWVLFLIPLHSPTAGVYRAYDELGPDKGWETGNDLEQAAIRVTPRLGLYREMLSQMTGAQMRIAGSGSTYFAEGDLASLGLSTKRQLGDGAVLIEGDGLSCVAVEVHEVGVKDV